MVAGITEFFAATMAIVVAYRSDLEGHTLPGRVGHMLIPGLIVAYPFLAIAYFGDRWGAFVEPAFFVMFSTMVLAELPAPGARAMQVIECDATAICDGSSSAELGLS